MIVQVPVGAVVKQLREGVRKADARGREGERRQKGRGREKAMLEDAAIRECRNRGWRGGTGPGAPGGSRVPAGGLLQYLSPPFFFWL